MARIDDPLGKVEEQHQDDGEEPTASLTTALKVATPIIGLLDPVTGAVAALASFVGQFTGERRRGERAEALRQGLLDGYGELEGRITEIKRRPWDPTLRKPSLLPSGKPAGQVARELDLTASALRNWVDRARADRTHGRTGLTTEEREELRRLRKENRVLRAEREILKTAAAFFVKENA